MLTEDTIYAITNFLFGIDLIICSRVNTMWHKLLLTHRKSILTYIPPVFPFEKEVRDCMHVSSVVYKGYFVERPKLYSQAYFMIEETKKLCGVELILSSSYKKIGKKVKIHGIKINIGTTGNCFKITGVKNIKDQYFVKHNVDQLCYMDDAMEYVNLAMVTVAIKGLYTVNSYTIFITLYLSGIPNYNINEGQTTVKSNNCKILLFKSGTVIITGKSFESIYSEYIVLKSISVLSSQCELI